MKCQNKNCDGKIDPSVSRTIFTPCHGEKLVCPCEKCGLLHWDNENPVFNRDIKSLVFLKDGEVVDADGNSVDLEN